MKRLMLVCLLATSAAAIAQTATPVAGAEMSRADMAKREAEEAKARARLDEARERLDKAAREVAELSGQLANDSVRERIVIMNGERRGMLGVQIDSVKEGARVMHVSPGGPAEEAGVRAGDVIIAVDGKTVANKENAGRAVNEQMREVKPEQKVKVRVLREGKNRDFIVVARPMMMENRTFSVRMPGIQGPMNGPMNGPMSGPMGGMVGGRTVTAMPFFHEFRGFGPGEFGGMELASITPKLGAYFGASDGVLVVQAPDNDAFKLEDGDVIQTIDGRKPEDGAHALRILRSYKTGEKLNLTVLRQRKPLTLGVTMPERTEFGGDFMDFPPSVPLIPPSAPVPGVPGGAGTAE